MIAPAVTIALLVSLLASVSQAWPAQPRTGAALQRRIIVGNDFSCRSKFRPVVVLHGLFATRETDLNLLETWLRLQGYCTFGLTYGAPPLLISVGGVAAIDDSAAQIRNSINEVLTKTGASKVDIVGHSEGGFQALYVAKREGLSARIGKIVALAPPTSGAAYPNLVGLGDLLRPAVSVQILTSGCLGCVGLLPGSTEVASLHDGPVTQPGNDVTVIATRYDRVVTPPGTASFIQESGVYNVFVQDVCSADLTTHNGMALDPNVWNLIHNALTGDNGREFTCVPYISPV